MEGLKNTVEGSKKNDARKEEGYLPGPCQLVQIRINMFCKERENTIDRIRGRGAQGNWIRGEKTTSGGHGGRYDAIYAVKREDVGNRCEKEFT